MLNELRQQNVNVVGVCLCGRDQCTTMCSFLLYLAFQEALVRQVNDMQELLGPEWGWVGVGRDDGQTVGEYSPLFYDKCVAPESHALNASR